jgi:hypothetical protein
MELIIDIKKYIAKLNKEAWYWLYELDIEFRQYASSEEGIKEYKKLHYDVVIEFSRTTYYLCGKIHREDDLPAYIGADGTQSWYINGKCHREKDLPAYIWADGTQLWYINDRIHREDDLPAVIRANGTQLWYINGILIK